MRTRWLLLIWTVAALWLGWWSAHNPMPDGFQNESIHVGNAYDLYEAVVARDLWHTRWYMYTGYWPWGFYAVPWPFLAVLGLGRLPLLLGNLVHLAALLWGANRLGRAFGAPLAPLILLLCPATFGALVRFEPNLADIAWVSVGLAFLVDSQGLRSRRHVLGWAAATGVGLLLDRLTVGFFLFPALLPLLWEQRRSARAWKNLALAGGVILLLTAAWYREFFLRNSEELTSQAPVGEIDSAGEVTVTGGVWPHLYYLLSFFDSQAGPLIGLAAAVGAFEAMRASRAPGGGPRRVLLAAVVVPVLFFTLIAKKQVYYTLPILGPLAVFAGSRRALAGLAMIGGAWAFAGLGLGWLPEPARGPYLPEAWVSPRHTLARPPTFDRYPFEAVTAALCPMADGPQDLALLSLDEQLFEGFVALELRARCPGSTVRGVTIDPFGTYERFAETDRLLTIDTKGAAWPKAADIERAMIEDHYDLDQVPPAAARVASQEPEFVQVTRVPAESVDLVVWQRRTPDPGDPPSTPAIAP